MIVGILGPAGCGGTFLDWTIQYLSGQNSTWCINCGLTNRSTILGQLQLPLVENPILKNTAHKHLKTHPNEYSVAETIQAFKQHNEFDLHSFYCTDTIDKGRTQTEYNKLILAHTDVKFVTYNFTGIGTDMIFCLQYEKIPDAINNEKKLITSLSDVPLNQLPIWDQRELMSLYYPKEIQGQTTAEKILPSPNNFTLNFDTVIENLDTVIFDLFDYLNIKIVNDRYTKWQQIYEVWKISIGLDFFKNLDTILRDILHNNCHDLTQYNMSFAKEIVIASKLLYNHNLTLKAYGKDNLSQNTQQWTEILEPNIYHNLTKK